MTIGSKVGALTMLSFGLRLSCSAGVTLGMITPNVYYSGVFSADLTLSFALLLLAKHCGVAVRPAYAYVCACILQMLLHAYQLYMDSKEAVTEDYDTATAPVIWAILTCTFIGVWAFRGNKPRKTSQA